LARQKRKNGEQKKMHKKKQSSPVCGIVESTKTRRLVAAGEQYALTILSYNQVLFVRKII